jgi:hypothetical protein
MAIDQELALVALKPAPGAARIAGWQVTGLEFLDQPAARGLRRAAVQAAGDHGGPILHRPARAHGHFAAVFGPGQATFFEHARVQFGAQAEPVPALAPFQADAPEAVRFGQFTDRDLKDFGCRIKLQTRIFARPPSSAKQRRNERHAPAARKSDLKSTRWQMPNSSAFLGSQSLPIK